jgi:hypothetical protein
MKDMRIKSMLFSFYVRELHYCGYIFIVMKIANLVP